MKVVVGNTMVLYLLSTRMDIVKTEGFHEMNLFNFKELLNYHVEVASQSAILLHVYSLYFVSLYFFY